jgi:hypothetical protein
VHRLRAQADQRERRRVFARQVADRERARRAGAHAGQVVRADQRRRLAGLSVEQQHRRLVVREALGRVLGPVAAGLEAEHARLRVEAGLDAEHGAVLAEALAHHGIRARLAAVERGKRVLHGRDRVVHRNQLGHQGLGDQQHRKLSSVVVAATSH